MFKYPFKTLYRQGFSLIEWMIMTVIVAILIAMFSQSVLGINDESKVIRAHQNLRSIQGALSIFREDFARYPTNEEGLHILVENPGSKLWQGPYIQAEILTDPWGIPYYYELTPSQYLLITLGQDQIRGGKVLDQDIVYRRDLQPQNYEAQ